jgi:CRP-like cAMP-binding protein
LLHTYRRRGAAASPAVHRRSVGSDGPERLGSIEFFAGLSAAQRRMLARHVDELPAEPGDMLMGEGDYGYEAIFIEAGSAEVRRHGEWINTVGPGEIVGELALVDPDGRRTATGSHHLFARSA